MTGKAGPRRTGDQVTVDRIVGTNIRDLRVGHGLSQEGLAERLGISFQQMRKYEAGLNRVTSSRMWDVAQALQVTVSALFKDVDGGPAMAETTPAVDGRTTRSELELIRAYMAMAPATRTKFVRMVVALAEAEGPAP